MTRSLNLPVRDIARLESMAAARRFLGLRPAPSTYLLFRDTYFDTPDGVLAAEGLTLRLRMEARGLQRVQLTVHEGVSLQGVSRQLLLEAPVVSGGLYSTLQGESEVSTRVRPLLDPAALRPRLAVDIDRETKELRRGFWSGNASHRVHFDHMVAHTPDGSAASYEVTLEEIADGGVPLESLGDRLRSRFGVEGDGRNTYTRILESLTVSTETTRPSAPHEVRIAPFVLRDGRVALVEGDGGLTLPSARGSGEDLAAEFVSEVFKSDSGRPELDLLGFVPAGGGKVDLEVWLHESPPGGGNSGGVLWVPFHELLERIGGPSLQDPGLRAAVLLLVRSPIGSRLLADRPTKLAPPTELPVVNRERERLLDLELSILDFNQRVLELAEDPRTPLLERFFFLSVFSSNMDEFFVVRVGRLKDEALFKKPGTAAGNDGFTASELLDLISIRVRALMARQYACLNQMLLPGLAERGIRLRHWDDLSVEQRSRLGERFDKEIFPLLTPISLSASPGRSFPRVPSLGLSLAAVLHRPGQDRTEFGYVPVPEGVPAFLEVPGDDDLILTTEVVVAHADALFTSAEVRGVYGFRVSRMSDVEIDEDNSGSLLAAVADEVEERPFKPVIRIEVADSMPREVRAFLIKELRAEPGSDAAVLTRADVYEADGPLDLRAFAHFQKLDVPGGRFESHEPRSPLPEDRSVFDVLSERDRLVHHPFDSFDASVGRFLRDAAADPAVAAIKLTLYRTGKDSPVIGALLDALAAGKEVTVFVELKARFDEESNIAWTKRLTDAGAHVVYGVVGYKTHAKTALVIRKEDGGVRRYVHVGTGNYNATTARFYTDVGLLSADPDLGADLHDFFNELTGSDGPPQRQFRRLLVAPNSLVQGILRMIEREIEHARAGRTARIQAKLNGLSDQEVVDALYAASSAGVTVDLIVRSICTLRPGVPGLSDHIGVRSILGQFLEHSRIVYFENAGQSEYYIGSADWRARNLRKRVEVLAPVDDPEARGLLREILDVQLADPTAWIMRADGAFARSPNGGTSSQLHFVT